MDIFRQSDMACRGPSGTLSKKAGRGSGCHAEEEQEQAANMFTFAGDSSLSGGKTKARGTSPAPAARRPRAIARRQLST